MSERLPDSPIHQQAAEKINEEVDRGVVLDSWSGKYTTPQQVADSMQASGQVDQIITDAEKNATKMKDAFGLNDKEVIMIFDNPVALNVLQRILFEREHGDNP